MSVLTLQVDGVDVAGAEGQSILDVARENGIAIPTMCHLGGLSETGLVPGVRRRGGGHRQAVPGLHDGGRGGHAGHDEHAAARGVPPDGRRDAVPRAAPRVLGVRREQPLRAPGPVGDGGPRPLRAAADQPQGPIDASHPLFAIDHNRCIMCVRCVRVCAEVEGACTWGVMGSGIDERVVTDMGTPWGESATCTSCGKCVQVCPTGALFEKGRAVAEGSKARRPFLPVPRRGAGDAR